MALSLGTTMIMKHQSQIVGNIGLFYVCYRLSLLGWNECRQPETPEESTSSPIPLTPQFSKAFKSNRCQRLIQSRLEQRSTS